MQLCDDPGTPPDAKMIIMDKNLKEIPKGGPEARTLAFEYKVKYDCNDYGYGTRTGYAAVPAEPLECVYVDPADLNKGVAWNGTVPTCKGKLQYVSSW